jgi:hypothetical protein
MDQIELRGREIVEEEKLFNIFIDISDDNTATTNHENLLLFPDSISDDQHSVSPPVNNTKDNTHRRLSVPVSNYDQHSVSPGVNTLVITSSYGKA